MGKIENHLIVGVAVDGGHGAALDLEIVVHHLGHRRQAVSGAGGVGNNVMFGRIVHAIVHAQHDGDVFVGGGGGDDDFFHRAAQVLARVLRIGEFPGGFDHYVGAHARPIQC